MKHRLVFASAAVLALAAAITPGCGDHVADTDTNPLTPGAGGSASTPGGAGNQVGSAGAGGGAPAAAGSGAATPGAGGSEGTAPVQLGSAGTSGATSPAAQGGSGGMTGAAGAASGGAGGAPPANPAALCPSSPSPSNGVMCSVTCTDPCGIFNLGTRLCTCTNLAFACATCAFTVMDPLLTPPTTPLPPCALADDAQEDDGSGCTDNDRCQSIGRTAGGTDGANRFCGCRMNEWDCDTKPASFGG